LEKARIIAFMLQTETVAKEVKLRLSNTAKNRVLHYTICHQDYMNGLMAKTTGFHFKCSLLRDRFLSSISCFSSSNLGVGVNHATKNGSWWKRFCLGLKALVVA